MFMQTKPPCNTHLKNLQMQRNNNIIYARVSLKYIESKMALNFHSAPSPVRSLHRNNHHQVYTLQNKQDTQDHVPHL